MSKNRCFVFSIQIESDLTECSNQSVCNSLPWDHSTFLGYSVEICFDVYCLAAYYFTFGPIIVLFISMRQHHHAFYKILKREAEKLELRDKTRNDAKHLGKLIRFHATAKE